MSKSQSSLQEASAVTVSSVKIGAVRAQLCSGRYAISIHTIHTMSTGSFPGVKRPGRGFDHPPPYSAEDKERVELYLYSTSGPSWPVIG
jgi:hypothetical protein